MRNSLLIILAASAIGCVSDDPSLDRDALIDPAYCQNCHPEHYRQWSGSMHAYASDDPMFIGMNERFQRETNGAAPGFCVGCHAPMAVRTGATTDGLNLAELPRKLRGVTCFFCHSVDKIEGDHNNALRLADDGIMRGGIDGPVHTPAHGSMYSPLHDGDSLASAGLCGTCHDVVLPNDLHLERTYKEWRESLFAKPDVAPLSCNRCHLPGSNGPAADVSGSPDRRIHEHQMPGIDMALSAWPEIDDQLRVIERDLHPSVQTDLCVQPAAGGIEIQAVLDNVFAGHSWPSGTTHARRAWVELIAYAGDTVVFESGLVAADEPIAELDDPNLWLLSSKLFDADDNQVEMPWDATSSESNLLKAAVTNDPNDPDFYHAQTRSYIVTGTVPDRITMTVHVRPVGLEIVDNLIDSGDLATDVRDRVPTFTLTPTALEWTTAVGFGCVR